MQVKSKILFTLLVLLLNFSGLVTRGAYAQKSRSTSVVTIGNDSYYVHTVASGETLYSLAKLYDVSEQSIIDTNPQLAEGLKPNQVLKIKIEAGETGGKKLSEKKLAKIFDQHIVNQGETAYSICKRYGLSLTTLIEDNAGLDPATLALGQKLNIRKTSVGDSEPQQIQTQLENYRDATNSVSDNYVLHLVAKGETIYSLSKLYEVAQDQITSINEIPDGLKIGMMIKVPRKVVEKEKIEIVEPQEVVEDKPLVSIRNSKRGEQINVAMLLPLQIGSTTNKSFLEFYQGALIALEDLKAKGINVELNLYNTKRSAEVVSQIVENPSFEHTDLIIGPIYEDTYAPVIDFAEKHGVAVVSPLANMERVGSHVLYQLSPEQSSKYDKLKNDLTSDKNVVVVSMSNNDSDFEKEISKVLPHNAKHFNYSKNSPVTALEALISGEKPNVFVVLSGNESSVDEFLARISSVQNNLLARSIKSENIKIIGTSRWLRFQNIDKNLYFKLGLNFVTSYHADRSSRIVMAFDKRYIAAFGTLPSLYSYRGYDAVKLFVSGMEQRHGADLTGVLNDSTTQLLQMPYRFTQSSSKSNNVNREWALVNYKSDYTIEVW